MKILAFRFAKFISILIITLNAAWLLSAGYATAKTLIVGWNTRETISAGRTIDLHSTDQGDQALLNTIPQVEGLSLHDVWLVESKTTIKFTFSDRTETTQTANLLCRYQITDPQLAGQAQKDLKASLGWRLKYNTRPNTALDYAPWWPEVGATVAPWVTNRNLEHMIVTPNQPEQAFQAFALSNSGAANAANFFEQINPPRLRDRLY